MTAKNILLLRLAVEKKVKSSDVEDRDIKFNLRNYPDEKKQLGRLISINASPRQT